MISYFFLLAAAFLWGTSFVAGKIAFGIADVPLVVLGRFLIASIFWLPTFIQASKSLPKSHWGSLFLLAFLMIPATFLLQFIGLKYTSAASAVIMIGFEPLMIVLTGYWFWKEKLTVLNVACSITAMIGVLLVMGWPEDAHFFGSALVLLSTIVVAIWVRWSKAWMNTMPVNAFTALTTVIGTALLLPCSLLLTQSWELNWTFEGSIAFIYLGVGCSLAAGWLWNQGLKRTSANAGGLFLALEPIFGVLAAAWILCEPLSGTTLIGAALVVLPVIISAVVSLLPSRRLQNENY
jgi:drug/metabolite transporter (DMT)-like permease